MDYNVFGWVEVPTVDLERAKKFYGAVLNVEFDEDITMPDDFKMAIFPYDQKAPGAAGALVHHKEYAPSQKGGVIVYLSVDGVTAAVERVKNAGGTMITDVMGIGENGFIAWFVDSEGNTLSLHSMKE